MIIYKALSVLAYPFIELYLIYRTFKGKEDKKRLKERFARATVDFPTQEEAKVIWIHAVSIGEANSALTIVGDLIRADPKNYVLLTSTTLTSASIIDEQIKKYNGKLIHQFLPIDSLYIVRAFLEYWKVKIAVFVESEIWPNLINEAKASGARTVLVNARMSDKSAKSWKLAKNLGFKIFNKFDLILAQSLADQEKLQRLTKKDVLYFGNLKSESSSLIPNEKELTKLKSQIGKRKIFLASSTHSPEEQIIIKAHNELKEKFPDLLTIIIPRHPNRSEEISKMLEGIKFAKRSAKEKITAKTEIYLADTLGELAAFYKLSNFTFIGASLSEDGGHNPFEPIKLGCAVISGKNVKNFQEVYDDLSKAAGCIILQKASQLPEIVEKLIIDPKKAKDLNKNANAQIKSSTQVKERVVRAILN